MNREIQTLIVEVIVRLARFFLTAWFLMLAFSLVHRDAPAIPAFGYWASVAIVVSVSVLTAIAAISWREAK